MPVHAGCSKTVSPNRRAGFVVTRDREQAMDTQDKDLMEEIERFAGSQDKARREVWSRLESYPRKELIDSLARIQRTIPTDDHRSLEIAFLLCNLNYEYQTNRRIVMSALTKKRNKDIPPDFAAELIIRLIQRGDKDLLSGLFVTADWADGAMADDLSGIFIEEMRTGSEAFLSKLKAEPLTIRSRIYRLIFNETTITTEDIRTIKTYLLNVTADSEVYPVAKEMLKVLRNYEGRR